MQQQMTSQLGRGHAVERRRDHLTRKVVEWKTRLREANALPGAQERAEALGALHPLEREIATELDRRDGTGHPGPGWHDGMYFP